MTALSTAIFTLLSNCVRCPLQILVLSPCALLSTWRCASCCAALRSRCVRRVEADRSRSNTPVLRPRIARQITPRKLNARGAR